jgi:membrane associated rhomboid family serine protease
MFFPYKIETLFKHWPIANWVIMALTIVMFFTTNSLSDDTVQDLVLGGTSVAGLVGHLFLHADFLHLAGNMLFLWVFGNAVCGMTSNLVYPLLYLAFGVLAAAAHITFDDEMAVGASGAINGVVGMAFAMYPTNRVSVFWFFFVRGGTFEMPLWALALIWCGFDAYGALAGGDDVAYWAHLGGFIAGLVAGIVTIKLRWVTLTEYDNKSLADLIPSKPKRSPKGKWAWEEPMDLRD